MQSTRENLNNKILEINKTNEENHKTIRKQLHDLLDPDSKATILYNCLRNGLHVVNLIYKDEIEIFNLDVIL